MRDPRQNPPAFGWPTLGLIVGVYACWALALYLPVWAAVPVLALLIAQHSSLQHEALHGHPFASQGLNDTLVYPPLGLIVPYARFKATHLAHHRDAIITDPYDDPESNYLDPQVWSRLPGPVRALLRLNNTLAGRLALGPLIGTIAFLRSESRSGDPGVARVWGWHLPAVLGVLLVVAASPLPLWAYLVAAYLGMSLLKLRTFLEHQAHDRASARSAIVERGGVFGLLFLNNNLHLVHHMHPQVPWYRLPALYRARAAHYQRRNGGYVYRSYGQVIRRYLFAAKDPVAHPLFQGAAPQVSAETASAAARSAALQT